MKATTIIHNDAVKYLVLAIIVCNCVFIEIIMVSLIVNKYEYFPVNFVWLGLVVTLLTFIAISIAPKDWKTDIAFKITDQGLVDQSTYLSLGYIPWSDIRKVRRIKRYNMDQIRVYLVDSQKYRAKKRPFARFLLSIKNFFFRTPIVISGSFYVTKLDTAYAAIDSYVQSQPSSIFVTN